MIVFGAYILSTTTAAPPPSPSPATATPSSFSEWLRGHANLYRLLDDLGGVKYKSDKVVQKCVVKFDHFPGIARIPFAVGPEAPNFRRIANEPIFGTAQVILHTLWSSNSSLCCLGTALTR